MANRRAAGGWALLVLAALLALALSYGFQLRWRDYGTGDWLAYWSYPRALLLGQGYSQIESLRPLQQSVGYDVERMGSHEQPIWNLHNPPPLLVMLLPFGALGFTPATLLWLALNATLYGWAALIYNACLPRPLPPWLALAAAALLLPLPQALFWGQITPLAAACLVLAWRAQRRGHQAAVGFLLLPLLIKPHLLTMALLLLGWIGLRQRAWRSAAALGLPLLLMTVAMTLLDPAWLVTWLESRLLGEWQTVSLSHVARVAFGLPTSVQFAGVVVVGAWLLWRFRAASRLSATDLADLSLLSVLVAPAMWHHDVTVMMPALLWVAARLDGLRYGRVLLGALFIVAQLLMPYGISTALILPYLFGVIALYWWARRPQAAAPLREGALL